MDRLNPRLLAGHTILEFSKTASEQEHTKIHEQRIAGKVGARTYHKCDHFFAEFSRGKGTSASNKECLLA